MSIDQRRRDLERYMKEVAGLQEMKAKEAVKAISERNRAQADLSAARRSTQTSIVRSKTNDAQRHEKAAVGHDKKMAEYDAKIAGKQRQINDAQKRLDEAERQEQKKREKMMLNQEHARARELHSIRSELAEHRDLHRIAIGAIEKMRKLPERITVLFLASNPLDQQSLRLDEEVRLIGEMIRKSQHRDAMELQARWAVRPLDVLQAINECRPRVLHFSGHGSESDEIIFQDNAGNAKAVSKEAIVQTIVAGSDDIQLVFFNTCYSRGQAQNLVEYVPAAIGMNTSIGDDAARVFSAAFYSAIGFGHSVGRAFAQAKAALMLESISEEDIPELFMTDGLDADDLVLITAD